MPVSVSVAEWARVLIVHTVLLAAASPISVADAVAWACGGCLLRRLSRLFFAGRWFAKGPLCSPTRALGVAALAAAARGRGDGWPKSGLPCAAATARRPSCVPSRRWRMSWNLGIDARLASNDRRPPIESALHTVWLTEMITIPITSGNDAHFNLRPDRPSSEQVRTRDQGASYRGVLIRPKRAHS